MKGPVTVSESEHESELLISPLPVINVSGKFDFPRTHLEAISLSRWLSVNVPEDKPPTLTLSVNKTLKTLVRSVTYLLSFNCTILLLVMASGEISFCSSSGKV